MNRKSSRQVILIFLIAISLSIVISGCQKKEDAQSQTHRESQSKQNTGQVIPVGKGPDAMFLTPDEKFLYIANVSDTTVSVINTQTDRVIRTISGIPYPWGFTRPGNTNLVAVSGWGKLLAIIDFTKHEIVRKKSLSENLGGIVSSSDGKRIFVVATASNKVLEIDPTSLQIVNEFPTGNGPDGIGISSDNSKLYVTNTKDGTISVIRRSNKSAKLINTGGKPELVHYNHNHSLLYISNFLENKIHILNTGTDNIIHEITGLNGPEEAVLSPQEDRLYVVNFNLSRVYVYDAKTYQKLPGEYPTGSKPIGIVILSNRKSYVTNYGDNSVSVIQLR